MKRLPYHILSAVCTVAITVISCNNAPEKSSETKEDTISTVQANTPSAELKSLFDGKTLAGWHVFNKPGEIKNWTVQDGALVCLGAAKDAHGGDLVSDQEYGNFELSWEWKVDKGSNSGVMYHVIESPVQSSL